MTELPTDTPQAKSNGGTSAPGATRLRNGFVTCAICAVIVVAFVGVDFLTAWWFVVDHYSSASEFVNVLLSGLCIAQLNLIAVWISLAPGNIVVRVSWGFLLTMAMWYALILGRLMTDDLFLHYTRDRAMELIAILLIGVGALQIPLWVAKKVFRWRLRRALPDDDVCLREDRQFHVRDMLIAMFLISVALSPLRQVLPPEDSGPSHATREVYVLVPVAILCNVVMTIPCIWWAFSSAAALIRLVFGWLFYCAVLTGVEIGVLCVVFGPPGRKEDLIVIAYFYVLNVSQCAAVLATLLAIRVIGFRLIRVPAAKS